MRKEWILTEEEKLNKKRRIEENRRLRLANTNEPINSIEKFDLDLQSVVLNKNKISSINSISSVQNGDVISNVVTAFNDGFKLDPTSYGWSYPLAKKITALCQILNTKNTTALRLISFYKRLAEFDALNEIDKVNLIKNNLPYIFIFHGSLGYVSSTNNRDLKFIFHYILDMIQLMTFIMKEFLQMILFYMVLIFVKHMDMIYIYVVL